MNDIKKITVLEKAFPDNCSGCRLCQAICSFEHEGSFAPWLARIIVIEKDFRETTPHTCNLCEEPVCIACCPFDALSRSSENGTIVLDEKNCTGCGRCIRECPYKAIVFDEERMIPLICNLCGGNPKCVDVCPRGILAVK